MSKFIANVIKLSSATLLGQILGIILSPVLSRLYSPADFGIFQLFFSIVSLIAIVACFSYQSAINLPKKDEDAANIVVLCLCIMGVTTLISTAILLIFSGYIANVLNAPGLSSYLFLVPLAVIANCVAYVLGFWLSRRQQFGTIATANLTSSITGKTFSVGLGLLSSSPFGLIFGTIINDITIVLISLRKNIADVHIFKDVSFEKIREQAIRYKKFPQFSTASALTSTAATQAMPFMLAFSFSPVVVGYYAMAHVIIKLPSKLVGNALSSIFFQKASAEKNLTGSITHIVKAVHTRLTSVGMFICLILMIIGPEMFVFFLGSQWLTAGVYAQILAPWIFVVFISNPISSIFNVFEKQGASLGFNVLLLISRIAIILIGGFLGDPILTMVLLSVTGVIFWSWMNMYLIKMAGVPVRGAILEILRFFLLGLTVALPLIIAKILSSSTLLLVSIAAVVTIIYYLIIVYKDPELKQGLENFLRNIIPEKS